MYRNVLGVLHGIYILYHGSKVAELVTVVEMSGQMKCSVTIVNLTVVDDIRTYLQHYLHTTVSIYTMYVR